MANFRLDEENKGANLNTARLTAQSSASQSSQNTLEEKSTRHISPAVKCGDLLYREFTRHSAAKCLCLTDCREIIVRADDAIVGWNIIFFQKMRPKLVARIQRSTAAAACALIIRSFLLGG